MNEVNGKANPSIASPKNESRAWYLNPEVPEMTEMELLITVMSHAEIALKRKNTILEAIEALDSVGVFNGTHDTSEETRTSVQKHLNWLLDSLDEANESYKLAREYVESLTEMPNQSVPEIDAQTNGRSEESVDLLSSGRDSLADAHAARLLLHASASSRQSVAELRVHGDVTAEMVDLLRSVGQLLLVSSAHGDGSDSVGDHDDEAATKLAGKAMQTAVAASVQPLGEMFRSPPNIPDIGNFETHLYHNALHSRQQALDSLMEAANLLNIELAAAHHDDTTGT